MTSHGVVVTFDDHVGLGEIEDASDRERILFHCAEIADGSRRIEVGTRVAFESRIKFGRREAFAIARIR